MIDISTFDYWDVADDLDLRWHRPDSKTAAEFRDDVFAALDDVGLPLRSPTTVASGPSSTLLLWLQDDAELVSLFVIPDEVMDVAMTSSLEALPWTLAGPSELSGEAARAAVRWMAALGGEGYTAAAFRERVAEPWMRAVGEAIPEDLATLHGAYNDHLSLCVDPDEASVQRPEALCRPLSRVWSVRRGVG